MQLALEGFNESDTTITFENQRYLVQVRFVAIDSAEMRSHLVARLTGGVEFPDATGGAPTMVSPASLDWLAQINLDADRKVFVLDRLNPRPTSPGRG